MRVCFGKTLAEGNLKVLAIFMTQLFNIEFEEERYKKEIPLTHIDTSHVVPLWVKLTPNK